MTTTELSPYAAAPPSAPARARLVRPDRTVAARVPTKVRSLSSVTAYQVRPYPATKLPTNLERQMMNRMAWGIKASTRAQMATAGGALPWFEAQLRPTTIPDPEGAEFDRWYPDRTLSAASKWATVFAETKYQWEYATDLANWVLLRRSRSTRQLLEVMTDFWSNHFHIPSTHDLAWCWRSDYDRQLRRGALGRFDDLLVTASLHPSMRLYLNNYESTKDQPNENQGRELLELHTVGVRAGYTEAMVKDSARILTGYTVNAWADWKPVYRTAAHATGPVRVLDFTAANSAGDGRPVAEAYLRYLASHPSTARRIATKLAVRFVSDTPPESLIASLAQVFLDSGTDISATLRALVRSPEFAAASGTKVRNPIEDFVATVRVLDVKSSAPTATGWPFAEAQIWMCHGQYPFQWPRPDGLPQSNASWCSASQVLGAFDLHYSLSGGWVGDQGSAVYRTPESWLPAPQLRFDEFVDHLSRTLLGRASTAPLLQAACEATGCLVSETVNRTHALVQWLMPRLLTAILDTPKHMSR